MHARIDGKAYRMTDSNGKKVLVIGLDCATPQLVFDAYLPELPNFRRLMEEGNPRLALRAMYLASLAMLAEGSRISIAKFKSNMDYQRELARRCHSMPQLLDAFGRNVGVFESVWYGTRETTNRMIEAFLADQRTIGQMIADA